MRSTRVSLAIAFLACVVFVVLGCKKKEERAPLDDSIAQNSAVEASDAISSEDLSDMQGSVGGLSPLGTSSLGPEAMGTQPTSSVLSLLFPRLLKPRYHLLFLINGPLHTLRYFYNQCINVSPGSCSSWLNVSGTCPSPSNSFTGNCIITINFDNSAQPVTATVSTVWGPLSLTFGGSLSGTVESVDGLPMVTATAAGLTITGPLGNSIIYTGQVSRQVTNRYPSSGLPITGASWVLTATNLDLQDSLGARATINGTRTVEVEFGAYFHAKNDGTILYYPPSSTVAITVDIDTERTITTEDQTKIITINDTITINGIKRTLSGQVTFTKEDKPNGELASVTINGSITRTGPRGSITVTFTNVIIDLSCNKKPWGGIMTISNGDKTYTIDFLGNCGCNVDITRPDGSTVTYDICTHEVVGND